MWGWSFDVGVGALRGQPCGGLVDSAAWGAAVRWGVECGGGVLMFGDGMI